jgi:Na+(H+)/acetate symporter ActP
LPTNVREVEITWWREGTSILPSWLSCGAAFISTPAVVAVGGAASTLGMGLLWLAFMNIAAGVFIAFVFFGSRTRRMGVNLKAITFPELLAKRYRSRFIQGFPEPLSGFSCPFTPQLSRSETDLINNPWRQL